MNLRIIQEKRMHRDGNWIYAKTWYVVQKRFLWMWFTLMAYDWERGASDHVEALREIEKLKAMKQ